MPEVHVNGISIYYEQHGWGHKDSDVLVLTNGVLMSTASWANQVSALSARYRLLLYDCRGMWRSEHPPGPYSMDLHARDLAALLDALEINRAHIGGISYGGEVSMTFALRYPERVRSLLLSSTVSEIHSRLRAGVESWLAAARARDAGLLYRVVYAMTFSDRWMAKQTTSIEDGIARYAALDFDAAAELFLAFLALDLTPLLHRIAAPTLVLVGEEDIIKPRKYAEIIAREIPHAELLTIPGAGHALCWEAPQEFNTAFLGFLSKHSTGGVR